MKIDLHCHTKSVKSGDGEGRNVSPEIFAEKIANADVKIVAITNHNTFDYEQYLKLKDVVKNSCQVWPGVELDINGANSKRWHLIIVTNPDNVIKFSDAVKNLFENKNLEAYCLELNDAYEAFDKYDAIYIPHYHKKPSISELDYETLLRLVGDSSRVFCEPQDHRSMGVFANHDYNVLIGSDVKDWCKYEGSTFAELRLPVSSFSQFCLLAKRDVVVVDTLLCNKKFYDLIASPHKSVNIPIKIFEEVNIIFGQKGTGKSEILNSMYDVMVSRGFNCKKYSGSDKEDDFKSLLKTTDMDQGLLALDAQDCKAEFSQIKEWKDSNPVIFSGYINWYQTRENNVNKSRMKITEAVDLQEVNTKNYKEIQSDQKNYFEVVKYLSKLEVEKYFSVIELEVFKNSIDSLGEKIYNKSFKAFSEIEATKFVNFSINKIKSIADKNSDTVSRPSNTGFSQYADNRLLLQENIDIIIRNLHSPKSIKNDLIGEIEGKGKILIQKQYSMLSKESKAPEFKIGIRLLQAIEKSIEKIKKNIFSADVSTYVNELVGYCKEAKVDSLEEFVGLSKRIVSENGDEYAPSSGERGILLLQQVLSSNADAYFLDEPELGMGNSYIDACIRPKISELAKQHKVVVVATHNANIAVRTLPYMSIFRTHVNGQYRTYTGNPFNDSLVNIENDSDVLGWTVESMHTLEGGKTAFYERKNIYESGERESSINT